MTPKISVIIVNYNAGPRLKDCIRHLEAQTYRNFETIVIDNGSTDGSADFLRGAQNVRLIEANENLGFAAGNNRAAEHAQGEWLALLNPDAYAAPSWLNELVKASERYRGVEAFGSTQIDANNKDKLDGAGDVFHALGVVYRGHIGKPVAQLPQDGECFAPCAAAALYRRATFEKLGGFYERFFCYCEDVDLGFRIRLAGGTCMQIKDAVVYHEGSAISGRHSDFTIYHGHRNRLWTYYLNMPTLFLVLSFPFFWAMNFYLLLRFCFAGGAIAYCRALVGAHKNLPLILNERKKRKQNRVISSAEVLRALTWSPFKLIAKEADPKSRALKYRAL